LQVWIDASCYPAAKGESGAGSRACGIVHGALIQYVRGFRAGPAAYITLDVACSMRLLPRSRSDQVSLAAFGLGAVLLGAGFLQSPVMHPLVKAGAFLWVVAYFLVVFDNLRSRVPVPTRGGEVKYEDGRVRYFGAYVFLVFFGAIFALVVLLW
jgi:hypothetical protein